jgi:hypothetical protein
VFGFEDQTHLTVASRPSADASVSSARGLACPFAVMPTVDQDVGMRVSGWEVLPLASTEAAAEDLTPVETLRLGDVSDA